jgi:hypothetical protein
MVHNRSPEAAKVAFFGALFAARTDIYATRWANPHTGKHGWIPAVRGMWRKGVRHEDRGYLPLTAKVGRRALYGGPVPAWSRAGANRHAGAVGCAAVAGDVGFGDQEPQVTDDQLPVPAGCNPARPPVLQGRADCDDPSGDRDP